MSFRRLVPYVTFLAILAMAIRPSIDTDTWWHLRAGEWILDHRQILRQDLFSFTMHGAGWHYPGWLAEVGMAAVRRFAGLAGLDVFTAVFVIAALGLVWTLLEGPLLLRSAVLLLAAAASAVYWSARPQIVSFAFTAAILVLIDRILVRRPRAWWWIPALMALWSNVHGGFALGLIVIATSFLGEAFELFIGDPARGVPVSQAWRNRRPSLAVIAGIGVASALAVAANPFGLEMLVYPWKTVSIGTLQASIQEWQSPDFHLAAVQPFLWMLVALLLSVAGSRRPMSATEVVRSAAFIILALLAVRNIASFAIVTAPVLSRHLSSTLERWRGLGWRSRPLPEALTRWINAVLAASLTLAAAGWALLQLDESTIDRHIDRSVPRAAFEVLVQNPPMGNLFHSYNWGGYVLWRLYPEYPSFVDGRTDVFSPQVLADYQEAWMAGPRWSQILETYRVQVVLVEPAAPLAQALRLTGWSIVHSDNQAILLRRPEAQAGAP
jgi:hypothetical protein